MHFSLIRISPPGIPTSHGLDDAILPLFYALRSLGYSVEILCNRVNPQSRNIVFGSCLAPRKTGRMLPAGSILFNLEQLLEGSPWMNHDYLTHLRDFPIWDYSPGNIACLERLGIRHVSHVPPGYVPEMTRIDGNTPQDVDVLFYGSINERRHAVIKKFSDAGLKILAAQQAFGTVRDTLLARSRLLLNIHYYVPGKLECVRLGYAFANRKAVVAEKRADTEVPAGLESACAFFPYADLLEGAQRLLADAALRTKQEETAFAAFSAMPMAATLKKLVGRRTSAPGRAATNTAAPDEQEKEHTGDSEDAKTTKNDASRPTANDAASVPEWLIADEMTSAS